MPCGIRWNPTTRRTTAPPKTSTSRRLCGSTPVTWTLNTPIGRLLFKLSVDQNLMGNILAAGIEIDPDQLRKARVRCVKEVKETNGEISFEDAVRYQQGAE